MKTPLDPQNPFGPHPKGFLWETLRSFSRRLGRLPRHFDYGAHDGSMLSGLSRTGVIAEGIGVDLNADVVAASQGKLPGNVTLKAVKKPPVLDFPDESFDSVSIIGVIEHIKDQEAILTQLHRILKRDGVFIAAVPGQHLFSFLDMGNFKFVFPRLHRWFYTWRYGAQKYRERYIECRNGLIGDVEVEKRWHQHFSHRELAELLRKCGFEVTATDGFGFFNRIIVNVAYFMPKAVRGLFDRLVDMDARAFETAEIFVAAVRRDGTAPAVTPAAQAASS